MPLSVDPDEDRRLNVRFKESFGAFFLRFSPTRADRFELADTTLERAAEVSRLVGREARALLLGARREL